jgi:hypothetical protein
MCRIEQQIKKVAKDPNVADAAGNFGIEARKLAQLVVGKGMSPAEQRAAEAVVNNANGSTTLAYLRRTHG